MRVLWGPRTKNTKTGDIPTGWIGETREESVKSCEGCALLPKKYGGQGGCYAQGGTPAVAHSSMVKSLARDPGKDYTLRTALRKRHPDARAVRLGAIGEPGAVSISNLERIRRMTDRAGLALLSYTHKWKVKPRMKMQAMASCDNLTEVDQALKRGWRAAVVLPSDTPLEGPRLRTPGGVPVTICPAIRHARVTCNDCRMCDAQVEGPVIGFPYHGSGPNPFEGEDNG